MATIQGYGQMIAKGVHRQTWEGLGNGDDGTALSLPRSPDRSVQVMGTFGVGGTIILEGSNDDGTTWFNLVDPNGNAISFTAAGGEQILENVQQIRPRVTAGDGTTDINAYLISTGR